MAPKKLATKEVLIQGDHHDREGILTSPAALAVIMPVEKTSNQDESVRIAHQRISEYFSSR